MNWLDFEVQRSKVKVTSHNETTYGQKLLVHNASFQREHAGQWFNVEDRLVIMIDSGRQMKLNNRKKLLLSLVIIVIIII